MAENFAFFVVEQIMKYTIKPILIQFNYMFYYNSKIQTLGEKVNGLQNKERELQQLVVEAERNVEAIIPGVTDLLVEADKLKKQAETLLRSATTTNSKMQCLFLTCPNLKTRYSLGREATKKTDEVAKLLKRFTYERAGEPKPVVQTPYQNPGDFGAFETRMSIKKEIMEALKNNDVGIIGICGMPGAGKTTMAYEIANQVKADKLFYDVAITVVSKEPNVIKIQDDLAEMLDLKIKDKCNIIVRAGLLHQRLGGDAFS